jgi:hypothetical protein
MTLRPRRLSSRATTGDRKLFAQLLHAALGGLNERRLQLSGMEKSERLRRRSVAQGVRRRVSDEAEDRTRHDARVRILQRLRRVPRGAHLYRFVARNDEDGAGSAGGLEHGGLAKDPWHWEGTTLCECTDPEGNVVQIFERDR